MKVMIDSNIIISAVRDPGGTPFAAYEKASRSPYRIILCEQIVTEVYEVFNRKFPDRVSVVKDFFNCASFEIAKTPDKPNQKEHQIRDVKDRPILRAALAAKTDILITGDKDFLMAGISKPLIITASDFIDKH